MSEFHVERYRLYFESGVMRRQVYSIALAREIVERSEYKAIRTAAEKRIAQMEREDGYVVKCVQVRKQMRDGTWRAVVWPVPRQSFLAWRAVETPIPTSVEDLTWPT